VLSFQDMKACCGSRPIASLNSSNDSRSVSFPCKELQMMACALHASNTKRNCAIVVTFMAGLVCMVVELDHVSILYICVHKKNEILFTVVSN
jgi:hypothetical protein